MAKKGEKLVPLTVRFTGPALDTIRDIADEHGFSAAEIVRFTVDNTLKEYLGSIQFLDYEQGKKIEKQLAEIQTLTSQIGTELNRIGVNYNQEIRLANWFKKTSQLPFTRENVQKSDTERFHILQKSFNKEHIDNLMRKYETVCSKVGELLCLIHS